MGHPCLFGNSDDIIFAGEETEILRKFQENGAKLVFGGRQQCKVRCAFVSLYHFVRALHLCDLHQGQPPQKFHLKACMFIHDNCVPTLFQDWPESAVKYGPRFMDPLSFIGLAEDVAAAVDFVSRPLVYFVPITNTMGSSLAL